MTDASPNSMPLMTVLTGLLNRRDAPGGLSAAVLSAALCGSMNGHLSAPGHRVSGNTNEPMPSPPFPPRNSDALVARDGFRTLADGASARAPGTPRFPGAALARARCVAELADLRASPGRGCSEAAGELGRRPRWSEAGWTALRFEYSASVILRERGIPPALGQE
jgi:hypothetical protein